MIAINQKCDSIVFPETKEEALSQYHWLCVSIVREYLYTASDYDDLVIEGNLGILDAFERFDINKGHSFSTFARYWIRFRIIRYLQNFQTTVRRSVYNIQQSNHSPYIQISLSQRGDNNENLSLEDLLQDESSIPQGQSLDEEALLIFLQDSIEQLPKRTGNILKRRFGLTEKGKETIREIAIDYNLSSEMIRKIQIEGLQKLKLLWSQIIKEYTGDLTLR